MSTGKLKAQYNRVRTSTALHTTSIWSNTIGLQQDQAGTNSAIEASIYAPGGGGRGRDAKRQRAQELIEATGFQPSVRDFDQLKALARRSGGDAAALNRGACKICGGLGHLTKQCRNFLDKGGSGAAAGAAGEGGATAAAGGGGGDRQLLTHADDEALLLDSDSMESSDLGSGSDSGSDRERKRRRKEKSSRDKEGGSSKKHKKEKRRSEKKHKKEKKHKRERDRDSRRSRSRSRSRDRSDRRRERSRSHSLDRRA